MTWTRTWGGVRVSALDVTLLLLAVFMVGCAPVATNVLNATTGDQLELLFAVDDTTPCGVVPDPGLCVVPGDEPALRVRLSVLGNPLTAADAPCVLTDNEAVCEWDTLDAPTYVNVDGDAVTASITYRRADGGRPYQEFAH